MAKFKVSIWHVLCEGFKIYFANIGKFTRCMLFPVFGQIAGIALIFGLTGLVIFSFPARENSVFNNVTVFLTLVLAAALPGFAIFLKAFWDYLVAYGALNSMTEAVTTTGKLYDFRAHTEVITKRSARFVALLLVITILGLIAVNPLFWVLGLIFFVYFVLVFQVFTFEQDVSVTGCFKRSLDLIKGNFARTFVILVLLGLICHWVAGFLVMFLLDIIRLSGILKGIFETWALSLPLNELNNLLNYCRMPSITPLNVANNILASSVVFVAAGLTLPLRSICWTLWYKSLAEAKAEKLVKKKSNNHVYMQVL